MMLGAAPFEQIHLSFPGFDVAVTTTVLTVTANAGSMVSAGALVHLLFLHAVPARRARSIAQGFELRVLQIAAGVWTASAAGWWCSRRSMRTELR
ncbi:hypothetical protein [Microbacterium sp. NIBRBAC000506063]|uniref:hypothetical protein n=1 Tax=Microbacterium sp. NIBRBAC000506063 TaxID=2734618 RepID=UPI001BB7570A|nr:hypothetical protein [Microbacterium sp. NIBRBAC000506063]QTV80359.1 hypothetical protein KAE78_05270 [Microbacterium sp. NIBRBAC000506063]